MKQYRFTGFAHDRSVIDYATINAYSYKEALQHARFFIRLSIVKYYSLKLMR